MSAKAWQWLQRGARLVWIVWPARKQVDVWTPGHDVPATVGAGDALDGRDIVLGFTYPLDQLFG
jgi:hypothetical protein